MAAYYNEIDPYCAAWLRNLIAAGHIAHGDVDERSIADVRADDVRGYDQCHFFAGIGGWSLALRLAGWDDDRACWTGSCPCQPLSGAGQRRGDADERHLWPAFHRIIAECQPAMVFGEQVASADGREWLAAVRTDLERLGYAVGAADLPAAGVGAPHIRQRLWFVAQGLDDTDSRERLRGQQGTRGWDIAEYGSHAGLLADADRAGQREQRGGRLLDGERAAQWTDGGNARAEGLQRSGQQRQQPQDGGAGGLGHADDTRSQGRGGGGNGSDQRLAGASGMANPWADCELGNANGQRYRGDEAAGRQAQHRAELASPWSDCVWLPCTDGKVRPVEPGIFPLAARLPSRVAQLRAAGNAIVPQIAAQFIRACVDAAD